MEFSKELRDDVIAGDITVSFRLWRRPKVKAGGRYPVGPGYIEVDSVELLPFAAITAADVRRAGEPDRRRYGGGPPTRARSPTAPCSTGSNSTWSGHNEPGGRLAVSSYGAV